MANIGIVTFNFDSIEKNQPHSVNRSTERVSVADQTERDSYLGPAKLFPVKATSSSPPQRKKKALKVMVDQDTQTGGLLANLVYKAIQPSSYMMDIEAKNTHDFENIFVRTSNGKSSAHCRSPLPKHGTADNESPTNTRNAYQKNQDIPHL